MTTDLSDNSDNETNLFLTVLQFFEPTNNIWNLQATFYFIRQHLEQDSN